MRKATYFLIPFLFLNFYSADAQYQVSEWYQQKSAAVTYTFDGYNNTGSLQLSTAVPLFDVYGYKVTLTTITDWISDWSDIKKAAENGHEIASLTLTHNSLAGQPDSIQELELSESQRIINGQIPNAYCLTLAFPYCETGNMDLVKKYYICGRICSGVIEPSTPGDLYKISSIITGDQGSVYSADHLNAKVELARESNGWCVFLIHGIDDDGGYSSLASRQLKKHLTFMDENDSVYWVATFLDAVKYIRERNNAQITEQFLTSDSMRVTVTDNLTDSIYNHPLTIERILPQGWSSAIVYSGPVQIPSGIVTKDDKKYVVFDAVPDKEEIFISREGPLVGIKNSTNSDAVKVFPNPFDGTLTVHCKGNFNYAIYSPDGKLMEKGSSQESVVTGLNLPDGSYILNIVQNGKSSAIKIVKKI
jgi:hypothetical protein